MKQLQQESCISGTGKSFLMVKVDNHLNELFKKSESLDLFKVFNNK